MSTDSELFRTAAELIDRRAQFDGFDFSIGEQTWKPLFEGKMVSHFDHRFGDYRNSGWYPGRDLRALPRPAATELSNPSFEVRPRYWVGATSIEDELLAIGWDRQWLFGWRDVANITNERTFVVSALPKAAIGHKLPIIFLADPKLAPLLQSLSSSFVFDYVSRQKLNGTSMIFGTVRQLACPSPSDFARSVAGVATNSLDEWVRPMVLELTFTSWRIAAYANDCLGLEPDADPGPPFRWDPARREQLRHELDAAMFQLYGLPREDVEHVMDSFSVVRKYDERDHGEFRTKRRILEIYDAMADAAARGTVYESPLDPPAGHGPRHERR